MALTRYITLWQPDGSFPKLRRPWKDSFLLKSLLISYRSFQAQTKALFLFWPKRFVNHNFFSSPKHFRSTLFLTNILINKTFVDTIFVCYLTFSLQTLGWLEAAMPDLSLTQLSPSLFYLFVLVKVGLPSMENSMRIIIYWFPNLDMLADVIFHNSCAPCCHYSIFLSHQSEQSKHQWKFAICFNPKLSPRQAIRFYFILVPLDPVAIFRFVKKAVAT